MAADVLPRLDRGVAELDAYTFHFFGTFGWISDVARRMVFYRFAPTLRWVNPVHEKLDGLAGQRDRGAVHLPPLRQRAAAALLARKHGRYFELGNPVPRPPSPGDATDEVYFAKAVGVRPYRGRHPRIAARWSRASSARTRRPSRRSTPASPRAGRARVRLRSALQGANETLRVALRAPGASRTLPRADRGPVMPRACCSAPACSSATAPCCWSRRAIPTSRTPAVEPARRARRATGSCSATRSFASGARRRGSRFESTVCSTSSESFDPRGGVAYLNATFAVQRRRRTAPPRGGRPRRRPGLGARAALAQRLVVAVVREPLLAWLAGDERRYSRVRRRADHDPVRGRAIASARSRYSPIPQPLPFVPR